MFEMTLRFGRLSGACVAFLALVVQAVIPVRGQNRDRAVVDRLLLQAQTAGRVRVIVGVAAPFTPEGQLSGPAFAEVQRRGISLAQDRAISLLPEYLRQTVRRFDTIPYMAVEVDAATLDSLQRSSVVTTLEEDVLLQTTLTESVPLIGGPVAWSEGATGAGWTVAVLDTGVDKTHPFLAGKAISEACYSSNATGLSTTVCPGGATSSTAPGSGMNCPYASCLHGTHVAGIATGKGAVFSGVAKDASLVAVQVFSYFPASNDIAAWTSDVNLGLQRVYALKDTFRIASVNLSLGGGRYSDAASCDAANSSTKAAIDQLRSVNIATVIASGNNAFTDSLASPACISSAVSVGSTNDGSGSGIDGPADAVSSFSNSASFLSLLAPGSVINSSVPGGLFANLQGTSMATPHVAGAWAVLRSAVPATLTVSQVLSALQTTGVSIADYRPPFVVKPRIKLDAALGLLLWGASTSRTPNIMAPGDFDGDGKADITVYRSSTGGWFTRRSTDLGLTNIGWGAPSLLDRPVPGDYDGDGHNDVAVYRQTTGTWFIRRSSDGMLLQVSWGAPSLGDVPVPADYDGDGVVDYAVFRTSTGEWFIHRSSNNSLLHVNWGAPALGDVPVPADYDGDGKADYAVYRGSTGDWLAHRSSDDTLLQASWGAPALGDVPVPADYDGDGKADFGVYRSSTGGWFIHRSSNNTLLQVNWGAPSLADMPVAADYDGDGLADIGVYRFRTGEWFILRSSDSAVLHVQWGSPGLGDSVREY